MHRPHRSSCVSFMIIGAIFVAWLSVHRTFAQSNSGQAQSLSPARAAMERAGHGNAAYAFLAQQMDQFHTCFFVYDDRDSGAVNFTSGGWMGDLADLPKEIAKTIVNDACTEKPYRGTTCIKITYPMGIDSQYWVGIYWLWPDGNWGNRPGYDLSRCASDRKERVRLTFWARGAQGGEQGEFKVGGVEGAHPDSFGPVSTGVVRLGTQWKQYTIDLTGLDLKNVTGGFCWATNRDQNPSGCVFYLDEIRFEFGPRGTAVRLAEPRWIRSYVPQRPGEPDRYFRNTAFLYDNALALSAFVARGSKDDLRRARLLADAIVYAQNHDRRFTDGRLRNAYACGELPDPSDKGAARLPGWWDDAAESWNEDKYSAGSDSGNLAWAMIGLLNYWEKTDHRPDSPYLKAATRLGRWVVENAHCSEDLGGYCGGMEGWEPTAEDATGQKTARWKSTEHNIDLYVAFTRLGRATADPTWQQHADHARRFVERMWNPAANHLWTGTDLDGRTIVRNNVPLDIQPWALLAFRDAARYAAAVDWAAKHCRVDGCARGCKVTGFDFNPDRDGVWWEGTAQMQLAFHFLGRKPAADATLAALRAACGAAGTPGAMPAACHDGLTTGFQKEWGDWVYYRRSHLGATCWYICAELGCNPYWPEEARP